MQEFSKKQFTSLPEDRQEHAFNMFITLDLETLSQVIGNELVREREALELQREAEEREKQRRLEVLRARQELQEVPRSQTGNNFNRFNPQQFQQQPQQQQQSVAAPQFSPVDQRPNFDPRRRQPIQQQQQFRQQQFRQQQFRQQQQLPQSSFQTQFQQQQQQPQPTQQDLRHFAQAEAQIQEAVRLQNCLANPSSCN